jgi:hypothetical protein
MYTTGGTPGAGSRPNIVMVDEANNGACPLIVNAACYGSHSIVTNPGGNVTGIDILAAWKTFTPAPASTGATIATTSARFNQMGKMTFVEINFTFSVAGNATMTFTLPNTPNSAGSIVGNDAINGRTFACRLGSGSTTATCNYYDGAQTFQATSNLFASGAYENQ